jgi:hypothetical protein
MAGEKTYELRIYPPMASALKRAIFGYFGFSDWADDVFRFLDQHCSE